MSYKFNNGNGAIICDDCRIIIQENISFEEYEKLTDQCGFFKDTCKVYNNKECEKENEDENS